MKWNENQRKIIGFDGGDLLVSASAGSGKTTVMLGRVMRLLEEGYSLRTMLISTFTVSAAEDMRAKLAEKLREKYTQTEDSKYLEEYDRLPGADICTLHKWCQKLIRKYFYVTGDDPAFEIADEAESAAMRAEAIDRAVDEASADPGSGFAAAAAPYIRRRSDAPVRRMIAYLVNFADSQPAADEWLTRAADGYASAACRDYLASLARERGDRLSVQTDALEAQALSLGLDKAVPLINELRAGIAGADVTYSVARGITPIKAEFDALKSRVKDYAEYLDSIASVRDEEAGRTARVFLAAALRARALYTEAKRDKGKLDFADLERKAREVLLSPAGDEVRRSLTHVFIDEYQDINPLQESIINLAGRGNLFFVGDIKQSIYAFRSCTPDAFARKRDELACGGSTVELNRNYRSRPGILRFCNAVFSRLMTESFGRVDYAGSGSFAVDDPPAGDGSVEIIKVPAPERNTDKEDFSEVYSVRGHADAARRSAAEEEADAVTKKVIDLLADKEAGYTCGDIVVLVRSRGSVSDMLARSLRAVGVPVSVSSRLGVSGGRVNGQLLSFMRLLDNFRDDVSLAAVMRGMGGFSDAELSAMRAAYPDRTNFYECVTEYGEKDKKTSDFLADVAKYTELAGVCTVGELAGRITSDKKLFRTAIGEDLGAAKADALGRLLDGMNAFGGTLSEYLEYIDVYDPASDAPPQPGSVRIMTVHASKGLEFPVVLMCGLGGRFRLENGAAVADGEFGFGIDSRVPETGRTYPSAVLLAARERKRRSELEEEMRILYVALTRARDKLVLFMPGRTKGGKPPEDCSCYAEWLLPTAEAYGMTDPPEPGTLSPSAAQRPEVNPAALGKLKKAMEFDFSGSPAEIKKSVTGLLAETAEFEDFASAEPLFPDDADDGSGADALARGTAFHACLEKLDFSAPFSGQLAALSALPGFSLVSADKLEAAHALVGGEVADAVLYREQPFVFKARGVPGAADGVILQGVIDLLAVRGGEAEIIDYKTGFVPEARAEKYRRQLDVYAAAVESVLGLKVTRRRIYLIDGKRFM